MEMSSLTRLPRPAEGEDVGSILRRHLAALLGPVFLVLCVFVASLVVSNTLKHTGWVPFCWIAFCVLFIRLLWRSYCWFTEYYMVTSERILWVSGTLRRKEDSLPLSRVTDIRLDQSPLGRILGFGNLVFESVCFDRFIWRFDCAPNPHRLLQELRESTFPDRYPRGVLFHS
jgi:membrane protein YdbS with pleckstrin-like domain